MGAGECILALPERIPPLQNVRSTLVIAGIAANKEEGDYARYTLALPEEHRAALLSQVAGTWLPLSLAAEHYRACDSLGYAPDHQIARGRRAIDRFGSSVYGTAARTVQHAGATPWSFLPQFPRFWSRAYDGAAPAIYKLGPKEALVDVVGSPLLEIPYYRHALQGWVTGMIELFCAKLYVRAEKNTAGPHSFRVRAQWV